MEWANPWQYSPIAWGSGLMNGFNPWANAWGMGGDDSTPDANTAKSTQPQQGGSRADGSGESAGFSGDATSGAYGMAKGAVGGLLGGLAKNAIATGVPAAALTGDAALGAGVGIASSLGPGLGIGMGNMAAQATGFAPSTTLGKGVTAAVQNPFGMGLLGGMFGPLGLALGAMAPFGAAAVEDGLDARTDESRRDSFEDSYGPFSGRTAYSNFEGIRDGLVSSIPGYSERAEIAATLAATQEAEARARAMAVSAMAGRGARRGGAPVPGGPFAGKDGFSVDNVFGVPGWNLGGYGQRGSKPSSTPSGGPMAGGSFNGHDGPGRGGNLGGGNSGGTASQGAKNGQGEGFGGR